jgi:hypothetical protein
MTSRAPFAAWLVAVFALTATPCRAGQQPVAATASASEDPVAQMPKTNDPVRLTATVVTTEKRPSALLPLYVSLAALQVTDGVATQWGVNHGRVESNPLGCQRWSDCRHDLPHGADVASRSPRRGYRDDGRLERNSRGCHRAERVSFAQLALTSMFTRCIRRRI